MDFKINKVKIVVMVPKDNLDELRDAICNEGAGVIGNYTNCSTSTKCIGTFKPNESANPFIGEKNSFEIVKEDKLEVVCSIKLVKNVISKIKKVHPYEEPAIDIIPLLDESNFE